MTPDEIAVVRSRLGDMVYCDLVNKYFRRLCPDNAKVGQETIEILTERANDQATWTLDAVMRLLDL